MQVILSHVDSEGLNPEKTHDVWHLAKRLFVEVSRGFMLLFRPVDFDEFERDLLLMENLGDASGGSGRGESVELENHVSLVVKWKTKGSRE